MFTGPNLRLVCLQDENAKLMLELKKGGSTGNLTAAEKKELEEEYKAQLEENEREMEEMKKSFEDKLAQVCRRKGEDYRNSQF